MNLVYASIYLLPATLFLLGIWMALRLLAELGVGRSGRRIWFVILATLLLSPALAGSVMAVVWVPNGLFLLGGQPPMLHLPRLREFAAISFAVTAVVSAAVAWLCIRQPRPSARTGHRWARMGAYVLGIGVLLGFYYARLPDRDIPEYVDWALIESEFGEVMDSLTGTREIESLEAAEHERDRLRAVIEADPIFWSIQFPDERFDRGTRGNFFRRQARSSGSCTGQPGDHHGLMRCTREVEGSRNRQTLRFVRRPLHEDSLRSVFEIEFDFEVFLDRYPGHVDYAPDAPTLQQQDQQLLGSWRLERRSSRGDKGPRREVVSLSVGPRLSPGKYAVQASVEMVPLDHSGPATDCTQPGDRCKWFGKSAGTLRIRGSRVQILYEERRWFSDRLQQTSEGLLGTDPWGDPVRFQRKE